MYSSGHGTETLLNKLLSPLQVGIVYRISFSSLLFFLKTNNVVKSHLITLNSCKRTVTSPSSSSSRSVCVCVCDRDMEILRPALINIHGRIYRKNAVQEESYEEEEDDYSYSEAGMCF